MGFAKPKNTKLFPPSLDRPTTPDPTQCPTQEDSGARPPASQESIPPLGSDQWAAWNFRQQAMHQIQQKASQKAAEQAALDLQRSLADPSLRLSRGREDGNAGSDDAPDDGDSAVETTRNNASIQVTHMRVSVP